MRRGKHGPGTTAKRVSRHTYETRGCWWAEGAWAHRQLCTQPLDLAGACVNILNFGAAGAALPRPPRAAQLLRRRSRLRRSGLRRHMVRGGRWGAVLRQDRRRLPPARLGPRCAAPPCTPPRRPGEGDQKRVRSAQQGRGPMCGGPEHRGTRASKARARAAGRCGAWELRVAGARVASRRAHLRLHLRPDLHDDLAAHARQCQLRLLASVLGALERVEQRLSVLGIAKHLQSAGGASEQQPWQHWASGRNGRSLSSASKTSATRCSGWSSRA